MPTAGFLAVCALAAIGYVYVARPIVHVAHRIGHKICMVRHSGDIGARQAACEARKKAK
jgi:hypothetical protein